MTYIFSNIDNTHLNCQSQCMSVSLLTSSYNRYLIVLYGGTLHLTGPSPFQKDNKKTHNTIRTVVHSTSSKTFISRIGGPLTHP